MVGLASLASYTCYSTSLYTHFILLTWVLSAGVLQDIVTHAYTPTYTHVTDDFT